MFDEIDGPVIDHLNREVSLYLVGVVWREYDTRLVRSRTED
jgi:hypothetical protein